MLAPPTLLELLSTLFANLLVSLWSARAFLAWLGALGVLFAPAITEHLWPSRTSSAVQPHAVVDAHDTSAPCRSVITADGAAIASAAESDAPLTAATGSR